MATHHIYRTRLGSATIHIADVSTSELVGLIAKASIPTLDLPAYAIHGGAQGLIYFNCNYIYTFCGATYAYSFRQQKRSAPLHSSRLPSRRCIHMPNLRSPWGEHQESPTVISAKGKEHTVLIQCECRGFICFFQRSNMKLK